MFHMMMMMINVETLFKIQIMKRMTYLFIFAYFTLSHTHTLDFFEGKVTRCDNSDNNDEDDGKRRHITTSPRTHNKKSHQKNPRENDINFYIGLTWISCKPASMDRSNPRSDAEYKAFPFILNKKEMAITFVE